jgi:hypothetical protein
MLWFLFWVISTTLRTKIDNFIYVDYLPRLPVYEGMFPIFGDNVYKNPQISEDKKIVFRL